MLMKSLKPSLTDTNMPYCSMIDRKGLGATKEWLEYLHELREF